MTAEFPQPELDAVSEPYWKALQAGRLTFQRCRRCAHAWLPPRSECPNCLEPDPSWETASGRARLISWVVYHQAFHPAFADRLPYTVAVVELLTNIVNVGDPERLVLEQPLQLTLQREGAWSIPRFSPVTPATDRDSQQERS
jgi:uncharacterized OB-fold protein